MAFTINTSLVPCEGNVAIGGSMLPLLLPPRDTRLLHCSAELAMELRAADGFSSNIDFCFLAA